MSELNRRRVLQYAGVAAGIGILGGTGVATDVLPGGSWVRRQLGMTGADGPVPQVRTEIQRWSRDSAARSRRVNLATAIPPGHEPSRLPVCLALHGKSSSVDGMLELGLPQFLSAAVEQGTPPFAVVIPDGGKRYWHNDGAGDDPMRMLEQELPTWLAERNLAAPHAVLGFSMGGFGALSYTRRTGSMRAAAVISPALFSSWEQASSMDAFPLRSVWETNDPLRRADQYNGERTAVWCGNDDPFRDASQVFAERSGAAVASFEPGAHEVGYWRRVLPEAMSFIGTRLAA